jgi:hypothetical protein
MHLSNASPVIETAADVAGKRVAVDGKVHIVAITRRVSSTQVTAKCYIFALWENRCGCWAHARDCSSSSAQIFAASSMRYGQRVSDDQSKRAREQHLRSIAEPCPILLALADGA